jgi:hypothetical protein
MMTTQKMVVTLLALPMLLGACGATSTGAGSAKISGKEGTASAVHALSSPTATSADRASARSDVSDHSETCRHGGTARLHGFSYSVEVLNPSVTVTFTLTLDRCGLASSSRGDALYTGDVVVTQKVYALRGTTAQRYRGTLLVGGAFDDTLDVDVTETEGLSDLTRTGALSVTLDGTAKTSRASHTFAEIHEVNCDSVAVEDNQ